MATALDLSPRRRAQHVARTVAAPSAWAGAVVPLVLGVGAAVVGIWAGIAPYVGPRIGFHVDSAPAWHWSSAHTVLALVPGAVAVAGGLVLVLSARRVHDPAFRWILLGCAVAWGLAGAWLALGPLAWPVLTSHPAPFLGSTARHRLSVQGGSSIAPGLVLAVLAGVALGRVRRAGETFESDGRFDSAEGLRSIRSEPSSMDYESVPVAPALEIPPWPRPTLMPEVAAAGLDETGAVFEWATPLPAPRPDAWAPDPAVAAVAMAPDMVGESADPIDQPAHLHPEDLSFTAAMSAEAESVAITPPPLIDDLPVWGPPEVRFEPEVWSPGGPPQTSTRIEHPTATYSTRPGMHRPPPGWQRPDLTEPPRSR